MADSTQAVVVLNLKTGVEYLYVGLTPAQAVLAAYALVGQHNGNHKDWEIRYGHLVENGVHAVFCGDFGAVLKEKSYG